MIGKTSSGKPISEIEEHNKIVDEIRRLDQENTKLWEAINRIQKDSLLDRASDDLNRRATNLRNG